MMDFVERSWTTVGGLRLSGRDYAGDAGPARLAVICLHGLTRNARDFEQVAPVFSARGRRVVALDVRGRGRSAWDPEPANYAVPVYVDDMIGWAGALGIDRAVFVGTSMGGLIAMALAAARPGLVASVVLNDIGPEIAAEGLARISAYTGETPSVASWREAAAYARHINAPAFPDYGEAQWEVFAHRLFREDAGRITLDYDPAVATPMKAPPPQPAPDLWPLFDLLARDRPLLLVRGAISDLLAPATRDQMRFRAPHMRLTEVAGVGHAPTLSEPEAVAALAAFLDEVD
ncbi:MAG: alpha/beta hydrolase [Caulobacteraceae bacterium]